LAAAGVDVVFVARGQHLRAIRENGLRVTSPLGDIQVKPAGAVSDLAEVDQADFVLVAVKLWDTEDVAQALKPLADRGAAIISFQNGVQKDAVLQQHLPRESIVGGVCYIASVIAEPGVIKHSGTMQRLVFGEYSGETTSRITAFLDACRQAGIEADTTDSIESLIWQKFVFLVGLSGTTTTMRQPIGPIRDNPRTRDFLLDVMREVVVVARARNIVLPKDYAADRLAFCDTLPATMTSSMHNDLEEGRRLELPWLSGGVVELAKSEGLEVPLNRAIKDILQLRLYGAAEH
jgi:2-dehydropantoate 2-reductase